MLAKTCQNCSRPIEATAANRTILICRHKQAFQGKFHVVAPNATCHSFKPARTPHPPDDGARLIPLTQGKFAIVDADDYERLSKHKWCACKKRHTFYAYRRTQGKKISMHRVIVNAPRGLVVDHKNRSGLNNRKSNLRPCTIAQNNRNSGPHHNATSKYKGVLWNKAARKWQARIRPNRRQIHLGFFTDEIEAAIAYDRKAEQVFGEFAYLNFPQLPEFRKWADEIIFNG
jgi:hypothetical protein